MSMIHKNYDGRYCISANQVWRPGSFDNEHTARIAQRHSDEEIIKWQAIANKRNGGTDGVITESLIRELIGKVGR